MRARGQWVREIVAALSAIVPACSLLMTRADALPLK
jgi:hypothetical protein